MTDHAPYQPHSETSHAAAEMIVPHLGRLQKQVLETIEALGPISDNDLITAMHKSPNTVRPRRIELVRLGKVRQAGENIGVSGRRSATWEAIRD